MRSFAPTLLTPRTPPLALRNVMKGGFRSLLAIAGVGFSITLVLLQLGFLEAVRITATTVFDQLDFDVALISPQYEQFFGPGSFPRERLREAGSEPGVVEVRPLYALMSFWRCPPYPVDSPRNAAHSGGGKDAGAGGWGIVAPDRSRSASSWSSASTSIATRSATRSAPRSRPPGRSSRPGTAS
jgi:hypothetical protein